MNRLNGHLMLCGICLVAVLACAYADFRTDMLQLVNTARVNNPLTLNLALNNAAQKHTTDMCTKNFFSHTGSDNSSPGTRARAYGYNWCRVGENIAWGTSMSTPASAFNAWMNSPGHRANILNANYVHMGVGYVFCTSNVRRHIWTQMFATPLGNARCSTAASLVAISAYREEISVTRGPFPMSSDEAALAALGALATTASPVTALPAGIEASAATGLPVTPTAMGPIDPSGLVVPSAGPVGADGPAGIGG